MSSSTFDAFSAARALEAAGAIKESPERTDALVEIASMELELTEERDAE